ncbi:MAG: uroporphyrinogen decarboxylase family protein, partial [Bacteroidota bacterium]
CRDMKQSLEWQLGGLSKSMDYKADIPNFIEPWYGIGTIASAFGIDYQWESGQAPAFRPPFQSVDEALEKELIPVEETAIGQHTLQMIEYFMDRTQGKLPVSPTDTQASLNADSFLVDTNNFFMEFIMNPEGLKRLLDKLTDLTISFTKKQMDLLGGALALPGHGFASSRKWEGLGVSSDVISMISPEDYKTFEVPCIKRIGDAFGGSVFHSCGQWADKIEGVNSIPNLIMVDAAFSEETDPDPNPCEPFRDAFAGTNVVVNARIVGDSDVVAEKVRKLWKPGMKLIVVTYCETPEEQEKAYDKIHEICVD